MIAIKIFFDLKNSAEVKITMHSNIKRPVALNVMV